MEKNILKNNKISIDSIFIKDKKRKIKPLNTSTKSIKEIEDILSGKK